MLLNYIYNDIDLKLRRNIKKFNVINITVNKLINDINNYN